MSTNSDVASKHFRDTREAPTIQGKHLIPGKPKGDRHSGPSLTGNFSVTLTLTLRDVIDPETFWMKYGGSAKAMLLDVFDGPVDMALNAEEVLLTEAREIR